MFDIASVFFFFLKSVLQASPHSLPIAFTIEAGDFLVLVKSHIPYITALVFQDLSMPSGFLPFSDLESAG